MKVVSEVTTMLSWDGARKVFKGFQKVQCDPDPTCVPEYVNYKPFMLCKSHGPWAASVENNFQKVLSELLS